jgi:diguanylate cyclase (GGDEF)-like protein
MSRVPSFELEVRALFRLARLISGVEWSFVPAADQEQRSYRGAHSAPSTPAVAMAFPIRLGDAVIGSLRTTRNENLPMDSMQLEGLRLVADAMERLLGVDRELAEMQAAFQSAVVDAAEAQSATQRQAIYSQQMKHLAHTDELTGLPNRRAFMSRWQATFAQSKHPDQAIGLLLIDADRFKGINDSGGHGLGDAVLRAIGASLQQAASPSDIVARLGGDEFAVCTTDADPAQLRQLAAAIRLRFKAAADVLAVDATLSIGMASCRDCPRENLLRDADIALYRSKEAGGDCAHLFAPEESAAGVAA